MPVQEQQQTGYVLIFENVSRLKSVKKTNKQTKNKQALQFIRL